MLRFACTLASIICTLMRVLSAPGHAGKQRVARTSIEVNSTLWAAKLPHSLGVLIFIAACSACHT